VPDRLRHEVTYSGNPLADLASVVDIVSGEGFQPVLRVIANACSIVRGSRLEQELQQFREALEARRSAITQVFQELLLPTLPDYRTAVLRMVEDYQQVFGGRDAELAQLDEFLARTDQPTALLLAPTGLGKTALLIHWVARVHLRGDWSVVFVPISLRYSTAEARVALSALAYSLAAFYGETERLQGLLLSPDLLRPLIAEWLRRTPPESQRLLVVLDGLDEALGWQVDRDLFPRDLPPQTKLLASAREMGQRSRHDWLDTLGWRNALTFAPTLRPLQRSAVADILQRMGTPLATLATNFDLLDEIERVSEGDPLTIRLLVEALRDGELTPDRLTRLPPGLESFVRDWLEELEHRGTERSAVRTLLELCAVALGPLAADDLEQLAPPEQFHIRTELDQAVQAVARFIIGNGSAERGYVFSHPRLRELYQERMLSEQQRAELRQRFVAYGERWYARLREDPSTQPQVPAYVRQFWVLHLAQAQRWELVERVLTEVGPVQGAFYQPWASLRLAAEGSYAGYLGDLEHLWRHSKATGNLGLSLRCALFSASIHSLSGNLSPGLLIGLVTVGTPHGRWSAEAALAHIAQMPQSQQQAEALRALHKHGCIPQPLMDEALNVARAIADTRLRTRAFVTLAPTCRLTSRGRSGRKPGTLRVPLLTSSGAPTRWERWHRSCQRSCAGD